MQSINLLLIITIILSAIVASPAIGVTEHEPILINSDADFIAGGFRGTGTETDPYIIESLIINSVGNMSSGVEVANTHAHFIIARCEIRADYLGINVHDVAPGTATIEGNVIIGGRGEGGGIVLGADGVRVMNNVCVNFTDGIHTNYADDCILVGNNFSNNTFHGISLRYSSRNLLVNNTIVGNKAHGIFVIRASQGNIIYNNTVISNSALKSYEWDNLYRFNVTSQAADEGVGNAWNSVELKVGNRWSDYGGVGVYKIDGSAGAVDNYPFNIGETSGEAEAQRQVGIPGFPFEAVALGLALGILYLRARDQPCTCIRDCE